MDEKFLSQIKSSKAYCSFCRRDLSFTNYENYNNGLVICLTCKEILDNHPVDETSPIVLFDGTPVMQSDAKVLNYFENELSLPLPPITLRNFLTEDEVYGYLIEDNQVVGLGLDGANIDSLSAIILNLNNLKFLSLKNNELSELPSFINSMASLEILDLTKNNLSSLPSLYDLDKINHLILKDNHLETLPLLPKNLQSLNVRWNRISYLENPFPVSLKILNIAQNRLRELPIHVKNLTQLEELNLYGNQLQNLPDIFSSLLVLKTLILRVNRLKSLPQSIQSLANLEVLDIEENNLNQSLDLSHLANLKVLNISKNKFENIRGINHCFNLINVDIRDNKFTIIDITGLDKLQFLDVSYNNFTSLPEGIESKFLLSELITSGNSIQNIQASEITHLVNLTRISFAKNKLNSLPDLSVLPNLQELYLNDNELEQYPNWLKKLTLRALTLDNNKFDTIEKVKENKEIDSIKSLFE